MMKVAKNILERKTFFTPKEEIISLLRGYFACPIIGFLGKRGFLDRIINKDFSINEFKKEIPNKELLLEIINYLESIGLVEKIISKGEDRYQTTEIGKKVFRRYGTFCLLHSYGSFFNQLEKLLFNKKCSEFPNVFRIENIIGSGQVNGRKYFPAAIEMLKKNRNLSKVIDIGCGNGIFLKSVLENFPNCDAVAVDISKVSLRETKKCLEMNFSNTSLKTIFCNGRDVSTWLPKALNAGAGREEGPLVISMWYFLHEISKKNIREVIKFFKEIYKLAPFAQVIVGEIAAIPPEALAKNRHESIMPEFLFFHQISGQGVLSLSEYRNMLKKIPYKLKNEKLFDILECCDEKTPSGFVWHLIPK
ncbi:MAG: class I SAM-dependent methyltransferase [Candidatus Omnitrophota bacterium]|jgi:SAM-dependent methyltransferase